MAKKNDVSGRSFETDLKRLENIVQKLENGLSIEEAILFYQEGMKLSNHLETRLLDIERKVFEVKNISKLASGEDNEMDMGLFVSDK